MTDDSHSHQCPEPPPHTILETIRDHAQPRHRRNLTKQQTEVRPVTLRGHALTTSWWDLALLSSVKVNAEAVAAEASPVGATVRGGAGVCARTETRRTHGRGLRGHSYQCARK